MRHLRRLRVSDAPALFLLAGGASVTLRVTPPICEDGRPTARRGRGPSTTFRRLANRTERAAPWERRPAPSGEPATYSVPEEKEGTFRRASV
jgi:hypothetical protein